jgi:hypothetical protein
MRIQVERRNGDPRAFFLGTRRLHVMRIVGRASEPSVRHFQVEVADGRVFALSHHVASDEWRLDGVNRHARPA